MTGVDFAVPRVTLTSSVKDCATSASALAVSVAASDSTCLAVNSDEIWLSLDTSLDRFRYVLASTKASSMPPMIATTPVPTHASAIHRINANLLSPPCWLPVSVGWALSASDPYHQMAQEHAST